MHCLLDSPRPTKRQTVNVCARIKCPYFHNDSSASKGCARYSNSGHCHLTSVFAFESDRHCLLTGNENALSPVKVANDGWITRDNASLRQLRHCDGNNSSKPIRSRTSQKLDVQIFYPYNDSSPPINLPKTGSNFQPISISLLNSIHFEEY
jgi:hypothetical protein